MELNIYILLKDKLKPEVQLIHVMSDRSNLKLSRLQIYRANEILLLFEKRPESMNKSDAPLYLAVNHTIKNSDKSWFQANAMGVNKLGNSLMKTMAEKSGLDNSLLTNHSSRKRMIQTLNDKNIPPSHIMQLSGHKNAQSINNYSHISQEQQKSMSRILSGSTSMVQTETQSLVETTKKESPMPTAARLFREYCVLRRKFHHQYQLVLVSNRSTKRQTYKRIKSIFDSSDDDDSPPLT